jgi:hypothetical protein
MIMPAREVDVDELTSRIAVVAAGWRPGCSVAQLRVLTGGASGLTYAATLTGGAAGQQDVVIKVAPPGVTPTLNRGVLRQAIERYDPSIPSTRWRNSTAVPLNSIGPLRRLAGAVGSERGHDLARIDFQVEVVHHGRRAVARHQAAGFQYRAHGIPTVSNPRGPDSTARHRQAASLGDST